MERLLVKTGIYGFIVSLALGILFIDTTGTRQQRGGYTFYEKDGMEYILDLLRFSIKITIVCMIVALFYTWYRKRNREK
ncbi:hypothetical protein [Alteribacillus iranensis]|uniref:Uncharacterized protein n=1 Tax=Alteribacillus iranensis TaxID=930128 RepID=A0A1I2BU14_9BACI|nr:hypothetical protein [Alteribacillus iranensis]SFE58873.1 hypothetical protein SAMN05192532_102473 [Alteribacillus iranensis]